MASEINGETNNLESGGNEEDKSSLKGSPSCDNSLPSTETTSTNNLDLINKQIETNEQTKDSNMAVCTEADKDQEDTSSVLKTSDSVEEIKNVANIDDVSLSDSDESSDKECSDSQIEEVHRNDENSPVTSAPCDPVTPMEIDDQQDSAKAKSVHESTNEDVQADVRSEGDSKDALEAVDVQADVRSEDDSKDALEAVAVSDNSNSDSHNSLNSTGNADKTEAKIIDISDSSENSNSKDYPGEATKTNNDISESSNSVASKDIESIPLEDVKNDVSGSSVASSAKLPSKISDKELVDGKEINESDVSVSSSNEELSFSKEQGPNSEAPKVVSNSSEVEKDEPLNFSSYSNKLNSSKVSDVPPNNISPDLSNADVNSDVKKRNLIYSDDDGDEDESMSSLEKLSCGDSESMDCEEISLDNTDPATKKIDHERTENKLDNTNHKDLQKEDDNELKEINNSSETQVDSDRVPDSLPELSNEETGFPEIFTGLVKVGKYISVKGDFTLRTGEALLESPSLVASYLLKQPDKFPPEIKASKSDSSGYFQTSVGEFLIGIGISRVNEWFHRDMVRIKKRQIKREGKQPQLEDELDLFRKSYAQTKSANAIFSFPCKSCETCKFTTESSIVMEGHLLVPHITPRREYQCNFCSVVNRDPRDMLAHMESIHKKVGRIQPPVLFYECPFCSFESNSKVKLNSHLSRCQRVFDSRRNQAPTIDYEFPAITPKPITVAMVKTYEKSMNALSRSRGRAKKSNIVNDGHHSNMMAGPPNHTFQHGQSILSPGMGLKNQVPQIPMPNLNLRAGHPNTIGAVCPPMPPLHLPPSSRFFHVVNSSGQVLPLMGNSHLVTSPSQFPFSSNLVNTGQKKGQSPNSPFFSSLYGNGLRQQAAGKNSEFSITAQLPKLQGPYPVQLSKANTPPCNASMQPSSLVVCEICDGYIKDLEQLRTHMQLIHKVKIHPKMLVSRPPLNCQKCQWRYFTDQGLERHLLGAHGLVTSNMQELANKNKDAGCCTICGRVYASKLVYHMSQVHKVTLKPAHLSYKCTVCSATFSLYRLFENHVYLVHSGAAKRPSDGQTSPAKKLFKSIENSDKSDSSLDHSKNRKDRENSLSKDLQLTNCKECGCSIPISLQDKKRQSAQTEKCEKCLKSDKLIQDGNSCTEELTKKGKECEKVSI